VYALYIRDASPDALPDAATGAGAGAGASTTPASSDFEEVFSNQGAAVYRFRPDGAGR
jgi:hypothetical protein